MVRRTVVLTPPNTLLGRLVWALATIVVMALGFFMLTAGLVVVLALTAVGTSGGLWKPSPVTCSRSNTPSSPTTRWCCRPVWADAESNRGGEIDATRHRWGGRAPLLSGTDR